MDYIDCIASTNRALSCRNGIDELFKSLRKKHPFLSRLCVSVTSHDHLENFHVIDHQDNSDYFDVISIHAEHCQPLTKIIDNQEIRVVADLNELSPNTRNERLRKLGHRSSFTMGLKIDERHGAVLFFNATKADYFSDGELHADLLFVKEVITSLLCHDRYKHQMFLQALQLALRISHKRDPETADHLQRMSLYSKLLAELLAVKLPVDHRFIQWIELYSPFHDIGKYRIPDHILFSPHRYTPEEKAIMDKHVDYGVDIIDEVLNNIDVMTASSAEVAFLKNIIYCHHERFDGNGYPCKIMGNDIPLEARIITIADVFDALLSKRSYKHAWTMDDTQNYIRQEAGSLFDPIIVQMLMDNIDKFRAIYERFPPEPLTSGQVA
ncbi:MULTISPECIES: HD-GYP domain-containing protein [Vibrio]|uniref:HD-GYP domain-containing protein n=1 Tax=Vibrio TaxID=662 RepID=UPI0020758FA0|nr:MULTISPECIES: HD domain-containing phosphohydrolase [Vibrio]MCY9853283.1 HD domain-containing protein [Vibrio mediterranei]MDA0108042.1 HD domain-containing protein [Vibrio sp. La 4.2.2]USE01732.1 HD domain-containing protein [Vibrio sp. SCSIO 43133]